jgi:hypothetical protein
MRELFFLAVSVTALCGLVIIWLVLIVRAVLARALKGK